jgi:hypothetical protein
MEQHWSETAERVTDGDLRILGETESGVLLVPIGPGKWRGRYRGWNPSHWRYWIRSRCTMRIASLEDEIHG